MLVKATGVPSEGLSTIASLDAAGVALAFRGQVIAAETGTSAAGDLEFRARDGARLSALAGLSPPLKWDGLPISGRLKLAHGDGALKLEKLALKVGGSRLAGQLAIQQAGDRRRIDASLEVDEASVAWLLAPLLDQRLAIAGLAEAAISGRQAWPDEPFSGAVLDAFEGNIRLSCKRLTLADGMALDGAKLDIVLGGGKISIDEIAGSALGGQFKGKVQIARAPAGVELRGGLRFNAMLEAFAADGPPRASGPVSGVLEFTGRGLSPRAAMSTLQGQGKLAVRRGQAADLVARRHPSRRRRRSQGRPRKNGNRGQAARRLGPVDRWHFAGTEDDRGRDRRRPAAGQVDRVRHRRRARHRLGKRGPQGPGVRVPVAAGGQALTPPGGAGKPLPPVTVYYRGPLASLGTIEPRIDTTALEQELSARKIEQDVEELERLRRLDEQRRLIEAERLRKQFEQTPPAKALRRRRAHRSPTGAPTATTGRPAAPG